MSGPDLVFDVSALVSLALGGGEFQATEALVARVRGRQARGWVAAQALPVVEYVVRSRLKAAGADGAQASETASGIAAWLRRTFRPLSLPGAECWEPREGVRDWEDVQIALAAASLGPGCRLVTEDREFDAAGLLPAMSPSQALAEIQANRVEGKIEFVDLGSQQREVLPGLESRIRKVLRHGSYIMGPEVGELEKKLGEYVGVKHAIGCASGTDALLLPLMALGVGPGDAVFTTPFTFIATAEVISLLGATPVFVDIDPLTYNIDPAQLDKAIRAVKANDPALYPIPARNPDLATRNAGLRPVGVIAVDLYGLPADYDALQAVCSEHGLFLIEDAAQSFGAEYKGKKACSFGDAAGTSFFPAKPLGCYGDGGMVFTNRDDLAEVMRSLRIHGKGKDKYDNVRIGLNARLDTLQAAVVLAKFEAFPEEVEKRQDVAQHYTEALARRPGIVTPYVPEGMRSAWAQYTVRVNDGGRKELEEILNKLGVPTAVYYPKPLHLQGAFRSLGYREGDFPQSEQASCEVMSLPFGPHLSTEHLTKVLSKVLSHRPVRVQTESHGKRS